MATEFSFNAAEPWHVPMAWAEPPTDDNHAGLAAAWLRSLGRPDTSARIARVEPFVRRFMVDSYASLVADSLVAVDVPFTIKTVARHARQLSDDERETFRITRGERILGLDPNGTDHLLEFAATRRPRVLREVTEELGWGKVSTQGAIGLLLPEHGDVLGGIERGIY